MRWFERRKEERKKKKREKKKNLGRNVEKLTLQLAVGERGPGDESEEREEERDREAGHFVFSVEKKKAGGGVEGVFFSFRGRGVVSVGVVSLSSVFAL